MTDRDSLEIRLYFNSQIPADAKKPVKTVRLDYSGVLEGGVTTAEHREICQLPAKAKCIAYKIAEFLDDLVDEPFTNGTRIKVYNGQSEDSSFRATGKNKPIPGKKYKKIVRRLENNFPKLSIKKK
tara:strand:- start:67 stop:444 length:378 start_codon:yes stop_codon:yes gene_type:complete